MAFVAVNQKQVMARGKGLYRGVFIFETKNGFEFFLGFSRHIRTTLQEATAFIDRELGGNRVL